MTYLHEEILCHNELMQKQKNTQIKITIPEELQAQLQKEADESGRSLSAQVRWLLMQNKNKKTVAKVAPAGEIDEVMVKRVTRIRSIEDIF